MSIINANDSVNGNHINNEPQNNLVPVAPMTALPLQT
jgi:hypothetical protein